MDFLQYEGRKDKQGRPHGQGRMRYKTNGDIYEGEWAHGLQQGYGVLKDAIYRTVYVGEWFRGKRHGQGATMFPSGMTHRGKYIEDEVQGEGTIWYADGGYYWGDLCKLIRHGKGVFRDGEGKVYNGDWVNDQKHGYGRLTESDGHQYFEGYWDRDIPQGRGTLAKFHPYSHSLTTYNGIFRNGLLQGPGFMSDETGGTYRGEFVDGNKHGAGTMYQPTGDMYQGVFRNDLFHRGVSKLSNGTNISGQFFNLLPDGEAAVDYQNGSYYQGMMTRGQREGQGVLHTMDGVELQGHFEEDLPDGKGKLRLPDGTEYDSMFVRGKEVLEAEPKPKVKPPVDK